MIETLRKADARLTATPNARMTTFASPTHGHSDQLSLWQVEMAGGTAGPDHRFDSEQIWTVISGAVRVTVEDGAATLEAGDAIVLPAGVLRRITAVEDAVLIVCGQGTAAVSTPADGDRGTPPWIA